MTSYDLTDGHEPMSTAEIDLLKLIAASLPPNPVIVNIGAADGVSTCAFLEARPDAFIFSIDILPCKQEFDNARACGLDTSRICRVLGNSAEVGLSWPWLVDFVYVDGDHWGAALDIAAWRDRTMRIGFHDYQEVCPPNNPGSVYSDVRENMDWPMQARAERVVWFMREE